MTHPGLQTAMAHCGLIAILRGITPADAPPPRANSTPPVSG